MSWIKVEEGLPDPNKLCMVYIDRFGYYPNFLDSDFIQEGNWHEYGGRMWSRVSHWQYFPEPPKE